VSQGGAVGLRGLLGTREAVEQQLRATQIQGHRLGRAGVVAITPASQARLQLMELARPLQQAIEPRLRIRRCTVLALEPRGRSDGGGEVSRLFLEARDLGEHRCAGARLPELHDPLEHVDPLGLATVLAEEQRDRLERLDVARLDRERSLVGAEGVVHPSARHRERAEAAPVRRLLVRLQQRIEGLQRGAELCLVTGPVVHARQRSQRLRILRRDGCPALHPRQRLVRGPALAEERLDLADQHAESTAIVARSRLALQLPQCAIEAARRLRERCRRRVRLLGERVELRAQTHHRIGRSRCCRVRREGALVGVECRLGLEQTFLEQSTELGEHGAAGRRIPAGDGRASLEHVRELGQPVERRQGLGERFQDQRIIGRALAGALQVRERAHLLAARRSQRRRFEKLGDGRGAAAQLDDALECDQQRRLVAAHSLQIHERLQQLAVVRLRLETVAEPGAGGARTVQGVPLQAPRGEGERSASRRVALASEAQAVHVGEPDPVPVGFGQPRERFQSERIRGFVRECTTPREGRLLAASEALEQSRAFGQRGRARRPYGSPRGQRVPRQKCVVCAIDRFVSARRGLEIHSLLGLLLHGSGTRLLPDGDAAHTSSTGWRRGLTGIACVELPVSLGFSLRWQEPGGRRGGCGRCAVGLVGVGGLGGGCVRGSQRGPPHRVNPPG
jgi:hypothetical protein